MIGSAEEFVRLRTSEDSGEYGRAANEEAPLDVWLEVIGRFPNMAEWVAHNKTVPLEVLRLLAANPDASVRHMVAMKRKIDVGLLQQLSRDSDGGVRHVIAGHRNAPREVLLVLAQDPEPFVAEAASKRL